MMELVDMRDLGSREAIRVGSSPTTRTRTLEQGFSLKTLALELFRNKIKKKNIIVHNTGG